LNISTTGRIDGEDPGPSSPRRCFIVYSEITGLGQEALAAEVRRCREVIAVAGRKRLSPKMFAFGS
jgi:hypothetical protein